MVLLDTDVMIDILRGYPPALSWLRSLNDDIIALPGFVLMELSNALAAACIALLIWHPWVIPILRHRAVLVSPFPGKPFGTICS